MENHLFFVLGLSFLLVHEMDAVRCQEWKLFIFLSQMEEQAAYRIFTFIHIPLYGWLFWELAHNPAIALITALDTFFIIHVLLHWGFRRHPDYQFNSWFSWLLIVGAGLCGALDLVLQV